MKPSQAFAILAFVVGRKLFFGNKLSCNTVNSWIATNGNRDNYGRGYSGGRLPTEGGNSYAEVRRVQSSNGKIQVTASIFFDSHQGPATIKTWEVTKLDSKLRQKFGDNLRFRVNV